MARTKVERSKGGRPPRTDEPRRLVTNLPAALKKRLQYQAIEEGRPAGAIVADALVAYLDKRKGAR